MNNSKLDPVRCKRCGQEWRPMVAQPKKCLFCKSYYWNLDREDLCKPRTHVPENFRRMGRPPGEERTPEQIAHAAYMKAYSHKESVKRAMRKYRAKPEAQAKRRAYRAEYDARPEVIEKRRARDRAVWAEASEGKKYAANKALMLKKQGLTFKEYQSLLAVRPNCEICGDAFSEVGNAGKFQGVHVDHDHATGQFRGLLCDKCNVGLGKFKDDPELLVAAACYLEEKRKLQALEALLVA